MTDQEARKLPLSKQASKALKAYGAKVSQPGYPPTDLLTWALQNNQVEETFKGSIAMMLNHLDLTVTAMTDAEAAEHLFGEEMDLDVGSEPDDVMDVLLEMLNLRTQFVTSSAVGVKILTS